MKRSVTFRPLARRDLLEHLLFLAEKARLGVELAERYFNAVNDTCDMLAQC